MEPLEKFNPPKFTMYDGKSDLRLHIIHYRQMMVLWIYHGTLMCRVFPSSLGKLGLRWFKKIPPGSIGDSLHFIKKSKNESLYKNELLWKYNKRYWELYNKIKGCSKELVLSHKFRLTLGEKLWDDLTLHPPANLPDLMSRLEKFAQLEDDAGDCGILGGSFTSRGEFDQKKHVVRRRM